jgi:hypothetical protein
VKTDERHHLLRLVRPEGQRPDQTAGRGVTAMLQCSRCGGWFGLWMCGACQQLARYLNR